MLTYFVNLPEVGWRSGWHGVGLSLVVATPICALLAFSPQRSPIANVEIPVEPGATLGQALQSACFWVFALSLSFFGLVTSGISLWLQLILEERGFASDVFMKVQVVGLLVGMLTNLVVGGLAYFIRLSHLLAAAMLLLAGAYCLLPLATTAGQAYGFAAVQGVAGGMLMVLFFAVWRHAFGAAHLGRIQGAAQMLTVLASAIGPLIVAESQFKSGSYNQILWTFAAVSAAFAVVAAFTPVPNAAAGAWKPAGDSELSPVTQESLT
jgi:hypothetical protein